MDNTKMDNTKMDNNNTITLIRQIIHPINKRHMSGEISKEEYNILFCEALDNSILNICPIGYLEGFVFNFKSETFFHNIMSKLTKKILRDNFLIRSIGIIPQIIKKYKIINPTKLLLVRFLSYNLFKLPLDDIVYFLKNNFLETQTDEYLEIIERETFKYEKIYIMLAFKFINFNIEGLLFHIPIEKFKELYGLDEITTIKHFKLNDKNFLEYEQPYSEEDFIFYSKDDKLFMESPRQSNIRDIITNNITEIRISLDNEPEKGDAEFQPFDINFYPADMKGSYIYETLYLTDCYLKYIYTLVRNTIMSMSKKEINLPPVPMFSCTPHFDNNILVSFPERILPVDFLTDLVKDYIKMNNVNLENVMFYFGSGGINITYDKIDYCVDILEEGKFKINFINPRPYIKAWRNDDKFNPDDLTDCIALSAKIMNYYFDAIAEKLTIYKHLEIIYKAVCCTKIIHKYSETGTFDNFVNIDNSAKLSKVGKNAFGFNVCGGASLFTKKMNYLPNLSQVLTNVNNIITIPQTITIKEKVKIIVPMDYMTKKDIEFLTMLHSVKIAKDKREGKKSEFTIEPLTQKMLEEGCETIKPKNPLIDAFVMNNCGGPLEQMRGAKLAFFDADFLQCYNDLQDKYHQCKIDASKLK